jgi:RNA-binding protein 25
MVPEVLHVGKIMTKEERMSRIKELVERIPTDKVGLWKWRVQWEFLSKNLLENKLTPFVAKKVVEYIGTEEKDLVEHIIEAVASRSGAQAVLNGLKGALAEDAEIFVIKLWRMVVYETEARSQGIS